MATTHTVNPSETTRQIYHELKTPRWWLAIDHVRSELGGHLAFGLVSGSQHFLRLLEDPAIDKVLSRNQEIGPLKIPVFILNTTSFLDLIYDAVDKELRHHPLTEVRCGDSLTELENYFAKRATTIEQLPGVQINLIITCVSGFKTELHDPVRLDKLFVPEAMQRILTQAAIPITPPPASRRSMFP